MKKLQKVTVIINNLGGGGAERYVVDSIRDMLTRGIDVHLITLRPEKGNSFMNECPLDASHVACVPCKNIYSIGNIFKIARMLRKQKPDLVITHLWFANTIGRLASAIARVPKVFSMEHSIHSSKSWKQRLVDKCLQVCSDKIIAVSQKVKESLVHGGIGREKISVVYVAVNTHRFGHSVLEKENDFTFIFVGRLNPPKNIETVICAFHSLDRGRLVVVGTGESEKSLCDLAHSLGETRVDFKGFVHDIPHIMATCHCFVFVPLWEALGLVGVEALLSGLPVITTRDSAMAEFVQDGYNGLLVESPTDVSRLAEAMKRIMEDTGLRDTLVSNTKKLTIDFSIEHNTEMIEKIYFEK